MRRLRAGRGLAPKMAAMVEEEPATSLEEVVARRLCLNTGAQVDALLQFTTKLVRNIVEHADEPKYRSIRVAAKALNANVLDVHGGRDVMRALGFAREMRGGPPPEPHLVLSDAESAGDETARLEARLRWLEEQCAVARAGADCAVQVRLPSGAVVRAAFFRHEPMRAVRRYAAHEHRVAAERSRLLLKQLHPPVAFEGDALDLTIEAAGLGPRAMLVAELCAPDGGTLAEGAQAEAQARAARARETAQEETRQKARERLERERQLKKVRADKQRDTEEQRHAALNAFREDRSEAAERVARQRRAEAAAAGAARAEADAGVPTAESMPIEAAEPAPEVPAVN